MADKFDANAYLEEAEKFQEHFVKPLVDAMRTEINTQLTPLVSKVEVLEKAGDNREMRIQRLETNQKKALVGYAAIVFLISTGFTAAKEWLFRWFNYGPPSH